MLKTIGLVIILSAGILQAEEVSTVPDGAPQIQHVARRGFHPLKAIQRMHDRLVNAAVGLSSVGIDQPADRMDEVDTTFVPKPLFSEAPRPACGNLQLTAVVLRQ
jgi:hypothetical protein